MVNATESYEVRADDGELHAISTIIEVLSRHVDTSKSTPNSKENIDRGRKAMLRCLEYVADRVNDT